MATRSGKSSTNKTGTGSVPMPLIVAVVIALVAFLSYLAYANLFAPPSAPPPTAAQQKTLDKYDALAKKSHGDINQLSPEERDTFMKETGGYGANILQSIAKQKGY